MDVSQTAATQDRKNKRAEKRCYRAGENYTQSKT